MVLVVQEGSTNKAGVVTIRSQHALCWSVMRRAYYATNEIHLLGCDHVVHSRYVIKHVTHMFISDAFLFHLEHGYSQDWANVAMEEHLQFVMKGF